MTVKLNIPQLTLVKCERDLREQSIRVEHKRSYKAKLNSLQDRTGF